MRPLWRILFLVFTVTIIASLPFIHYVRIHAADRVADQTVVPAIDPDLVLKAPDTCEIGELVRLDVRDSKVEGIEWRVLPQTDDFEVIEDGRRAFFSSRVAGEYLFMIAGAKGGKAFLMHQTITVAGGAAPGPGPVPVQTIAQKIDGWVKKVPDYEGKKAHAAGLAAVFTKMADAKDVKVEQILEATALANSAVLGAKLDDWVPFLEALGQELDAYVAAGTLTTREHYREIWLQIAKSLEKAAK